MNLADIYRLADTKRWQIVKTAKPQSVAEHMYAVAMIARRIGMAIGMTKAEIADCVEWALWHDVPEVYTGDIAAPVKQHMYEACGGDPLAGLERKLCGEEYTEIEHRSLYENGGIIRRVVKLADLMEAIKFLQQNACTDHGHLVKAKIWDAMGRIIDASPAQFPDFKWLGVRDIMAELIGPETSVDDLL